MKTIISYLRSRTAIFTHNLLMVPIAWFGAYWLRFNLDAIPEGFINQAIVLLPVVWIAQGGMFWYFGLYRGIWRFASIPDLVRIIKAVAAGIVIAAAGSLSFLWYNLPHGCRHLLLVLPLPPPPPSSPLSAALPAPE